jgi:acyl-CoA thioesterase
MFKDLPPAIEERLRSICDVPFATEFGMELIHVSAEEVRVTLDVSTKHNALGSAHGGAVFTLADQAFAIASNMGPEHQVALTATINYIRPARGKLMAVARKVGETKRTSLYEVLVYSEDELVAVFSGTGFKLREREPSK